MGRQTPAPEGYVTRHEAAVLLHASLRQIDRYTQQRLLRPQLRVDAQHYYFLKSDVEQLAQSFAKKNATLPEVRRIALQALSSSTVLERRVSEIYEALGLAVEALQRDPASIRTLARSLEQPVTDEDLQTAHWVRSWASQLMGIDQVYFELAGEVLGDDEPWKRYIDFARTVKRRAAALAPSGDLARAYKYFDAALQNLNSAGHLYCRAEYGRRLADRVFGGATRAVDELEAVLAQ